MRIRISTSILIEIRTYSVIYDNHILADRSFPPVHKYHERNMASLVQSVCRDFLWSGHSFPDKARNHQSLLLSHYRCLVAITCDTVEAPQTTTV